MTGSKSDTGKKQTKQKTKKLKNLPQTAWSRAARLGWLSTKLIAKNVKDKLQSTVSTLSEQALLKSQLKMAEDLVGTLSNMKGAAMKAGQMLALDLGDMIPAEVRDVLYKLSDDSSFLEFEKVQKILKKSLGAERYAKLSNISSEPIAAASIGQVHTGTYQGKKVAIKVQYPGVAKSIDADMFALEKLIRGYLMVTRKKLDIRPFFSVAKTKLKQEADYRREANSLNQAKQNFLGHPGFRVPEAYLELCTPMVLVMAFEEGVPLKSCISEDKPAIGKADKKVLAALLLELLFLEYFKFGHVQTDPNLGNFFFDPKAGQLVLLDMGSIQSFKVQHRLNVREMLAASLKGDSAKVLAMGETLDLVSAKESDAVKEQFVDVVKVVAEMFSPGIQPFDFSSPDFLHETRSQIMGLVRNIRYTSPAKQFAFLNRKLGGIYHVLRTLGHKHDMRLFWELIESFVRENQEG